MKKAARVLPPVDMEIYVPAAITVVRRSPRWPGILLHERRGKAGEVNYPGGIRQHVFYCFLKPLVSNVILDGTTRTMHYAAGEGRFTPAANPVAFQWQGEVHVLMLGFQPWFFERIAAEIGAHVLLPASTNTFALPADHAACQLMGLLRRELDGPAGASLMAEGLARSVAVALLREFEPLRGARPVNPAPPTVVLRAVELMRERIAETLSLEEIAEEVGLSAFHFARQFKVATGYRPHDYHVRLRVDRAQELIRHHGREWTMAAIATECGFADQSHMARHFKRVLGVAPREFAAAQADGK
jgi:AraC family transcriptional regulator